MTARDPLLDLEPSEIGRLLIRRARTERAPAEARQRALSKVSGIVAGAAAASGVSAQASALAAKSMPWLFAKSLVVGMGTSALLLATTQALRPQAGPVVRTSPMLITSARAVPAPAVIGRPETSAAPVELSSLATAKSGAQTRNEQRSQRPLARNISAPRVADQLSPIAEPMTNELNPAAAELTREVTALQDARSSLARDDAGSALRQLSDYDRDFPAGALRIEAAALRIEALLRAGQRTRAEALGSSFLQNHAESPLAARVRVLLKIDRAGSAP